MTCCKEQNVTEGCLGICSAHQLDLDLLLYSPQCVPELDKLMTCGSGKWEFINDVTQILRFSDSPCPH